MKIGTRKSPLALKQAEIVRAALLKHYPNLEIEIIALSTSGDRFVDRLLSEIGGKGLFTKELEEALLANTIDIAVHSMKDMATTLPDGLIVPAILKRDDARDMLVGPFTSLSELPHGTRFGTSSLRRAAQLKMLRPDLEIVPFRGNVQTRLAKLDKGEVAATMLACAGLKRLNLQLPGVVLETKDFLPAVAQGAIGIECREADEKTCALLQPLNDADTSISVACERAFLKVLDGSCRTPIAGYATIENKTIFLRGLIAKPDGSAHHAGEISGDAKHALSLGQELGERLRQASGNNFIQI